VSFDARAFLESLLMPDASEDAGAATAQPESVELDPADIRPEDLPERWYEWWAERAAIREHQGGQAREHAQAEALKETLDAMRATGEYV
jgi:hypothetical protein